MSDTSRPWPALPLAHAHALLTRAGSPFEMDEVEIRGARTRVWKFAPPTLREVFLAGRIYGDRVFLVDENDRVTFEAFARATVLLANELVAKGVRKGDRVAIVMRNLPEFPVAFFATVLVGAIATPLNAWWTGPELQYALTDCGAKVALVDAERLTRLLPVIADCPHLERLYVCRATSVPEDSRIVSLESVIGAPRTWHELPTQALPAVELLPDDDATIFYTSGTTGRPRGALGTHRNSTNVAVAGSFSPIRNLLRRGEPIPAPDPAAPQKAMLLAVPFFHVTGCMAVLNGAIATGGKIVLMHRWDALRGMELIERERCTAAGGVPTI